MSGCLANCSLLSVKCNKPLVLHELGKRVVLQVSRLWAASAASADGVRDSSWPVALQGDAHLLHSAAAELPPARHS